MTNIQDKIKCIPKEYLTDEENIFWRNFNDYVMPIAELFEIPVYWVDLSYRTVYVNSAGEISTAIPFDKFIGHVPNDFYNEEIAEEVVKTYNIAKEHGFHGDHIITDYVTKNLKYYNASLHPIYNKDTGNLMGLFGISIDITDKKRAEELQKENQIQKAELVVKDVLNKLTVEISAVMNKYRVELLNQKIGTQTVREDDSLSNISLTSREKEILYYLSHNKSPCEIAQILSILDQKIISDVTIYSIINKQLFAKFNVSNTGDLVTKANHYNLIPFV